MLRLALLISSAALLFASVGQAYTLHFQPTLEVWKCPPGAVYVIMQCTPVLQQQLPKVALKLETVDTTDPAYTADWSQSATAPGEPQSYYYLDILRYHDAKGRPFVSLSASAGWDANSERNGSLYFDMNADAVPATLMVTGDRRIEGDHEIVTDLQLVDLKFTK